VLISCGAGRPRDRPQTATQATHRVAHVAVVRRLLAGNGIATVRFSQPRALVRAELERLLGRAHETIPGICGFGRSTDWIGLNINTHSDHASAELNLSFKHARFVGYAYVASHVGLARQDAGIVLASAAGLTLGDTVARARELYGRAFMTTTVRQGTPPSARLPRLPVGRVSTASGEIVAGLEGLGRPRRHSTVEVISAGEGPNTPCR